MPKKNLSAESPLVLSGQFHFLGIKVGEALGTGRWSRNWDCVLNYGKC